MSPASIFSRCLSTFLILFAVSACSVYRSESRKQFENRAQGRIETNQLGISANCWTQPLNEALWTHDENRRLVVTTDTQHSTQHVCLEEVYE
jgi:hypothetical protein